MAQTSSPLCCCRSGIVAVVREMRESEISTPNLEHLPNFYKPACRHYLANKKTHAGAIAIADHMSHD